MNEVDLDATLMESDGFLYLKIPDEVISAFLLLMGLPSLESPEVMNVPGYVGAHISVATAEETTRIRQKSRKVIREIGKSFRYRLGTLCSARPRTWDGVREVYFLTVSSPELESLRLKYRLGRRLNGHDFHITVAVRRDSSPGKNTTSRA